MTLTLISVILLLSQVGLLGATLWLRYLSNKNLFKTDQPLKPIRSKHGFFGAFSRLYDLLDRIPFLRRSGTANEFDLLKAMLLTTVPILFFELLINRPSALVVLLSVNFLLFLVNIILLAHPVMKRITGGK